MKRSALIALVVVVVALFALSTVGRYEYINRPGSPLRVDRFTGRTYALQRDYNGGVSWVALPTKEEAHAAAIRAWGPPPSPKASQSPQ